MFYDFVRVEDADGARFSVRKGFEPAGVTVIDDVPATRPDGSPLPPESPKKKTGQKADPTKEK